jgi:hypothetical protein
LLVPRFYYYFYSFARSLLSRQGKKNIHKNRLFEAEQEAMLRREKRTNATII